MIISLLLGLAGCSIYALDVGSENLRLAVSANSKPIEIKTNERDQRSTPNFLAYPIHNTTDDLAKEQWIVGSEAERIFYRNSTHAVRNPFQRLWTPTNTDFAGLSPVVAVSALLYNNLRFLQPRVDKVTLVVPLYTSPQVRYSLHQSMKLLGYRSVSLLDSCTAVASLYGVERVRKGQKQGTTILFVDIGAENIDCSLWKFKIARNKTTMELLQYRHSNSVGGSYVDQGLIKYASQEVGKEFVGSEIFTVRNILRKAKERLSANKEIGVDLTEDYGKYLTLTQEKILEITKDMNKVIYDLLKDIDKPDEIELIGGSSRLKAFTDVISEVFPNVTARRSLNAEEAICFGAAYNQALKGGTMIGNTLEIKKPTIFGLNVTIGGKTEVVYEPGDLITESKIDMPTNDSRIISTTLDRQIYDEYMIDSADFNSTSPNFTQCLIENVDSVIDSLSDDIVNGTYPTITLSFGNSPELDCPDLISATLNANITTTNPRLIKRGHGNTTITERKLFVVPSLIDTDFHVPSNARTFIRKLVKADEDRRNRQESCHKIESFIIDTREKALFDDEFKSVTTEEERKDMIERLEKERETVDCTTMISETSEELEKRLSDLQKLYEKPLERLDELIHRPIQLQKLKSVLERADEAVPNAICDNETLEKFHQYVNETRELIANVTSQDNLLEQPCFLIKDMKEREKELLKKIPELKRPPKKSNVVNFSTSDADDMDDDEYDRLKSAGIMFNRPRKRKTFDIPEHQDMKEDLDKERKEFRKFKDVHTNESRDFRDSKRNFQSDNRDFYRFDSQMRRNDTFLWIVGNLTEGINGTIEEIKKNLTKMREDGIARREKINEERRYNATKANATDADGNYDEKLHKELMEKMRLDDIKMKADREEARRIRQEEEKKKKEEEEERKKKEEEEERKRKEEEEEEKRRKEEERKNQTETVNETVTEEDLIGEPPEELDEKGKEEWLRKKKAEIEAKKFLEMNADSIDDDLKPLTDEEIRNFEDMKKKFEGSNSKPFESEEDRIKYETERRQYEQIKRRYRQTPTPKPTKTPKPSESPTPEEWEELADDFKSLTEDEDRYYTDRVKHLTEQIEFEELKKVFEVWKVEEDERKAKEQAEREERERKRNEERERRQKEEEERRQRQEEERQKRIAEEEERRKQREADRERRRLEMEQRQKEMEEARLKREQTKKNGDAAPQPPSSTTSPTPLPTPETLPETPVPTPEVVIEPKQVVEEEEEEEEL